MHGSAESHNDAVPMRGTVAESTAERSNLGGRSDTPNSAIQNAVIDLRCQIDLREQHFLAILDEFEREMEVAARRATAVVIGRFQQRIERERQEARDRCAAIVRTIQDAA